MLVLGVPATHVLGASAFQGEAIQILDNDLSSPGPARIDVSGLSGTVVDIRVRINGLSHTNMEDVDVFLDGPNDTYAVVFSDAGDFFQVFNESYLFTDYAQTTVPFDKPLFSGTYRPANYSGNSESSEFTPFGSTEVASLRALANGGVNGPWELNVWDDNAGSSGSIDSWELEIETHRVTPTGSMLAGRRDHATALLPDGRILVTGGSDGSGTLNRAEVFDPGSGRWSAVGDLTTPRSQHSAVVLPDGRVLITGGLNGGTTLASAELFDPATGTFTPTASLAESRANHSVTLLGDGRVLVAGGNEILIQRDSAEIFDPATQTWSGTGSLGTARSSHTATLLQDGTVMVAGGNATSATPFSATLANVEIFDPETGTWSASGSLSVSRSSHGATRLVDGRVAVIGGGTRNSILFTPVSSIEIYDPNSGNWSTAGNLNTARFGATGTLLPDGRILVVGGNSGTFAVASSEIFDPGSGVTFSGAPLQSPRDGHTATMLPGGRILICGGSDGSFYRAAAEIYDPSSSSWQRVNDFSTGRALHTATLLPDGRVLIAGGEPGFGAPSIASAELYDPETDSWSVADSLATARKEHTATLLPDGRVLVVGGRANNSGILSSAEIYDPSTGTWSPAASMKTQRTEHTATLLSTGQVLVAGGLGGESGFALQELEIYDPQTESWTVVGALASARRAHTATLLADGRVLFAGGDDDVSTTTQVEVYDPTKQSVSSVASLTAARGLKTATLLPDGRVLLAGGVNDVGVEIFDPASDTLSPGPNTPEDLDRFTASLTSDGLILLVGDRFGEISALYDPSTNAWFTNLPATVERRESVPTLLPDGSILFTGGYGDFDVLSSAERFTRGGEIDAVRRPLIASLNFEADSRLVLSGSGLRAVGAYGGGTGDSATDYPLIQLRRIDSGSTTYLRPDSLAGFSATSFESGPRIPYEGHVLITPFVNGLAGRSQIIRSTISQIQDFDGDGLNDAAEAAFTAFGFSPIVSQPELITIFESTLSQTGYYDKEAFDANFAAGEASVLGNPNAYDLFTLSQIQDLNVGVSLIRADETTGQFKLTIAVESSADLETDPFTPFPMSPINTQINAEGELEFTFDADRTRQFYRLNAQ